MLVGLSLATPCLRRCLHDGLTQSLHCRGPLVVFRHQVSHALVSIFSHAGITCSGLVVIMAVRISRVENVRISIDRQIGLAGCSLGRVNDLHDLFFHFAGRWSQTRNQLLRPLLVLPEAILLESLTDLNRHFSTYLTVASHQASLSKLTCACPRLIPPLRAFKRLAVKHTVQTDNRLLMLDRHVRLVSRSTTGVSYSLSSYFRA